MSASDISPSSPHQHLPDSSHTQPSPMPPGDPDLQTLENPRDRPHSPLNVDPQDPHQQEQGEEDPEQQGADSSLTVLPSSGDFPAQTTHTSFSNPSVTSPVPSSMPILRRLPSKRKKGKGNFKKQQAIEKKYSTLVEKLKPVPFSPAKLIDFAKREKLLKWLGLWDFVHIDFDKDVRVDLVAQLVVSYDPKTRCSYVNEHRILVNRADLARALKLPVKKEKAGNNAMVDGVDLDSGEGSIEEDSIGFIEDLVSIWVLLHEDTWMMPNEVLNWINMIKDGHPEKVDWAGLIWFMVEKELMQGEHLENCYYASHLQYLIKVQREDVFVREDPLDVDMDVEQKEEEGGVIEGDSKVGGVSEGQEDVAILGDSKVDGSNGAPEDYIDEGNSKVRGAYEDLEEGVAVDQQGLGLTLGQGGGDKEGEIKQSGMREAEMLDFDEENEEQKQWISDRRNIVGEHFLQHCNGERRGLDKFDVFQADNEAVEAEGNEGLADDGYDITLEGGVDGTGNLIGGLETRIAYGSQGQHRDHSAMDLLASENDMPHGNVAGPSHFGKSTKREIGLERSLSDHSLNGCNKRIRIDEPWDDYEPSGFGACMEEMRQVMNRATMMYAAKERSEHQLTMQQQLLLSEMQQRGSMIEQLHKSKCEEIQKRDEEIFRLERELLVMGALVDGYRRALKETQKSFDEYRQRYQLPEEPIYKDAGPGGIMLTAAEIEVERRKREEEDRSNCLMIEQKAREFEEVCGCQLTEFLDKVQVLDKKLEGFENEMKQLKESWGRRKGCEEAENQVEEDPERATKG